MLRISLIGEKVKGRGKNDCSSHMVRGHLSGILTTFIDQLNTFKKHFGEIFLYFWRQNSFFGFFYSYLLLLATEKKNLCSFKIITKNNALLRLDPPSFLQ